MTESGFRFDLARYCARIGYDGPRTATLDVLRALHRLHPRAIAFENLDSFAGRRVSIALDDIAPKLVDRARGGYCFEQNMLFAQALEALGFGVTRLAARVAFGRPAGTITPRTHMLLRVEAEGEAWLADVGFGAATLCAPLSFATADAQPTPLEPNRLSAQPDGTWKLEVDMGGAWADVYTFELARVEHVDFEMANWYVSTFPGALFVANLVVCTVRDSGRATLFNDRYSERDANGNVTLVRRIGDARALGDCLGECFGIDASEFDLDALFARVAGRGGSD